MNRNLMRFWRSVARILAGVLVGLSLMLVLHACSQAAVSESAQPESPSASVSQSSASPSPSTGALSPEVAAIVASAAPTPLTDPPRGDVRLAVISDLNSAYGSTDYEPEVDKGLTLLPFWKPDLVLCSGDMVAGQDPSLTPDQIRAMWAGFDRHIAAPLRQAALPFGFTVGNHDASSALAISGKFLFQQERSLASDYWNVPDHDPGVQFVDRYEFPFYYTFESHDIFFLTWDGSSTHIPPEKLAWVEQALSSQKAQQAKLRILVGHLPLYAVSIGRDEPGEVLENADALREMLERYKVHTYISGHDHAYYPAHKGNLQLLHMGILGAGPRPLLEGDRAPLKALTIVDINFNSPDRTTYTTYDMQTLQPIQFDQLPRFLTAHNGLVLRRDVEANQLSASEKASCVQKIGSALCAA